MEKMTRHSARFLRQRKLLLLLPILVFPFITLLFWALGGGKDTGVVPASLPSGLNTVLPDAQLEEEDAITKLQFYERAEKKKKMEDSFWQDTVDGLKEVRQRSTFNPAPFTVEGGEDMNEAKVYRKLEQLNRQLASRVSQDHKASNLPVQRNGSQMVVGPNSSEPEMATISLSSKDPQLEELNAMMDKILDIQHPERVKNKMEERSVEDSGQKDHQTAWGQKALVTLLDEGGEGNRAGSDGFFGMSSRHEHEGVSNITRATVHQTQTVSTGSTIKLRLLEDCYIHDVLVPGGSFVTGVVRFNQDRLFIDIPGIHYQNNLLPVNLKVFDLDGLQGLSVPGASSTKAINQAADQQIRSMDVLSLDPSLKSQAATLGVQTVKSLLSKKVKQVKVTLKGGHQVLLKEMSNQKKNL